MQNLMYFFQVEITYLLTNQNLKNVSLVGLWLSNGYKNSCIHNKVSCQRMTNFARHHKYGLIEENYFVWAEGNFLEQLLVRVGLFRSSGLVRHNKLDSVIHSVNDSLDKFI
jgi:hypothetical protein